MLESIRRTYELFEQLNISVTGLLVIGVVLSLAFLFSIREAASWFLKVDDVKKDIKRLRDTTLQLEEQIRALQGMITQAKSQASLNIVPPSMTIESENEKTAKSAAFPIVH